jgi:hypothetical protein
MMSLISDPLGWEERERERVIDFNIIAYLHTLNLKYFFLEVIDLLGSFKHGSVKFTDNFQMFQSFGGGLYQRRTERVVVLCCRDH